MAGAHPSKQESLSTAALESGEATEATLQLLTTKYITRLDEASSTITYVGEAAAGSSSASAVWRIFRMDTSSGLVKLYAGTSFNQIWDNRASLSYS